MPKPTIMITGVGGLLGPYLYQGLADCGSIVGVGRNLGDEICDLEQPCQVRKLMQRVKPEIVVHAAAMTDVDECQRHPDEALRTNSKLVEHLVSAMPVKTRLVMISTDQVYPNTPGPHEEDSTAPVNSYGRSKLAGEYAALKKPGSLVLRTNFFGLSKTSGRSSLSDWLIDALAKRQPVTLFKDVQFSPLHMSTVSEQIVDALAKGLTGIFNLGCREGGSKMEFGILVAKHLGLQTNTVTFGNSASIPARAPRPLDLRMIVRRIETALRMKMPTMKEEIEKL